MNIRLLLSAIIFLVTTSSTVWSAPVTTYVAPFAVSGVSKPEEMKMTIQSLLLSRLASDKIATVNKPEGAEITVSGSYLLSGSFFSLDASAVDRSGATVARSFTQGKSTDELILAVGDLAKKISSAIEKNIVHAKILQATTLPADVVKPAPTLTVAGQQHILKLDGALNGIAIGRTLPDGKRELFVVGSHVLRYYHQGSVLQLMAEIKYKAYENVLAVDTVDIDDNKVPEVYVTIMQEQKLVSQVWTVEGASMKQIAGPLPYYFRAVSGAGGVKKLYAQQISDRTDFSGDVSEVVKSGNDYKLTAPVKLPKLGYLYNFNILKGPKGESVNVIFDRSGYLRVFDLSGEELWKSPEEFSGSETYFKRIDLENTGNGEDGYRKVFLDQRIIAGPNGELFVPRNMSAWYMFGKHYYKRSSMYCLVWDGTALVEKWHTNQNDNYLSDFAYDNSSHELLMLEVTSKEDGVFYKGASRLVIKKVE